mgnify:CR=1 FL=1
MRGTAKRCYSVGMKSIIPLLLASFFALANTPNPTLCQGTEKTMFACTSEAKLVSLCASADLDATKGYIQYRLARKGKVEFEFPKEKKHPNGIFTYEFEPNSEYIRFKNGDYGYTVQQDFPEAPPSVSVTFNGEPFANFECTPTASHNESGLGEVAKAGGFHFDAGGNPPGTVVPKGAAGTLCVGKEQSAFSCFHRGRLFSLCASPDLDKVKGYLQYRASRDGKVEFEYPKEKVHPKGRFTFSSGNRSWSIDFKDQGREYSLTMNIEGWGAVLNSEGGDWTKTPCTPTDSSKDDFSGVSERSGIVKAE